MNCCVCGKEIDKQYAPDYANGLYCEKCAKESFLNSVIKTLDVPCDEYKQAEKEMAECLERFKEAWRGVARAIVDGINGKNAPIVEENPKIDRCEGCIHRREYRDMGATTPICRKGGDLVEAAKMRNEQTPCKFKMTWKDVDEKPDAVQKAVKDTVSDIINLLDSFNRDGGNTYAIKLIQVRYGVEVE